MSDLSVYTKKYQVTAQAGNSMYDTKKHRIIFLSHAYCIRQESGQITKTVQLPVSKKYFETY